MLGNLKEYLKILLKKLPIPLSKNHMYDIQTQKIIKRVLKENGIMNLKTDSEFMHGYTLGLLHGEGHEVIYANHDVYVNEGSPEEVTSIQTFYEN